MLSFYFVSFWKHHYNRISFFLALQFFYTHTQLIKSNIRYLLPIEITDFNILFNSQLFFDQIMFIIRTLDGSTVGPFCILGHWFDAGDRPSLGSARLTSTYKTQIIDLKEFTLKLNNSYHLNYFKYNNFMRLFFIWINLIKINIILSFIRKN